ncbi:hypothetical protein GTB64_004491 [Salmonella enterica]|nr:hypothetical protein [Salmonella enterica]
MNQPIHLAWGSGDVAWDAQRTDPSTGATDLEAEVGRRKVTQTMYCTPKSDGEIIVSQGRFTASVAPTKYLYLRFAYDFTDGAQATIRELGVFVGSQVSATPASPDYFLPAEVTSKGQLLVLEHIDKLVRSQNIRQQFEFVIQF